MTTAVKKKEEAQLPAAMMADFEADAGGGMENVDNDCIKTPFLKILHDKSPQLEPTDGKYVAGAKTGDIFNTITQELVDGPTGVTIIPVYFERKFIEWEGTKSNSGLVEIHDVATGIRLHKQCTKDAKNNYVLPNGHCIMDAREHYVLVLREDGTGYRVLISMTKSQLSVSADWVTAMGLITWQGKNGPYTPPSYSHSYKLTTVTKRSRDGEPYKSWHVSPGTPITDEDLVRAARKFKEDLQRGRVELDRASMGDGSVEVEETPF